jgi:phage regulator Rha-like protein
LIWVEWLIGVVLFVGVLALGRQLHGVSKQIMALGEVLMAKFDEMKAELAGINEATNEIAVDVEALIAKLAETVGKVLTEAEAAEIITDLQATATKLRATAAVYTPETQG